MTRSHRVALHPSPTRWRALAVLAAAQFLIIMDTSIIGVALMTAVASSAGADQLGDVSALTDGYAAAFVGAGLIAVIAAVVAFTTIGRRRVAPSIHDELTLVA